MIIDKLSNIIKYIPGEYKLAILEITSKINEYSVGQHKINDKIIVKRIISKTHKFEETKIESHRHHIDIQIPLNVTENMNVFDIDGAVVQTEYDCVSDVVFYRHIPPRCIAEAHVHVGEFILLLPNELHQPQIADNDMIVSIDKIVIKVEVD